MVHEEQGIVRSPGWSRDTVWRGPIWTGAIHIAKGVGQQKQRAEQGPKIIAHSPAKDEVSTDMSPLRG